MLVVLKVLKVENVSIFCDSEVIIDWAKGDSSLHSLRLGHWASKVHKLISSFRNISFLHVYREYNTEANLLSKLGNGDMNFYIHYETWKDARLTLEECLSFLIRFG